MRAVNALHRAAKLGIGAVFVAVVHLAQNEKVRAFIARIAQLEDIILRKIEALAAACAALQHAIPDARSVHLSENRIKANVNDFRHRNRHHNRSG